jgi:hypothetical protein
MKMASVFVPYHRILSLLYRFGVAVDDRIFWVAVSRKDGFNPYAALADDGTKVRLSGSFRTFSAMRKAVKKAIRAAL